MESGVCTDPGEEVREMGIAMLLGFVLTLPVAVFMLVTNR
jgi:hypothetical protein